MDAITPAAPAAAQLTSAAQLTRRCHDSLAAMVEDHPVLIESAPAETISKLRAALSMLRGGASDISDLQASLQQLHKAGLCSVVDMPDLIAWPHRLTHEATAEQWDALYRNASRHTDLSLFEVRSSTIHGLGLFVTRDVAAGSPLGMAWWQYQKPRIPGSRQDEFMTPDLGCRYLPTEHFLGSGPEASKDSSIFDGVPPAFRSACYMRAVNHDCHAPTLTLAFVHGLPPCQSATAAHGSEARCVPAHILALPAAEENEFVAAYYVASAAISAGEEVTLDFRTMPEYMKHEDFENADACPPPVAAKHLTLQELDPGGGARAAVQQKSARGSALKLI